MLSAVCVCVFRVGSLVAHQLTRLAARVLMPSLKKLGVPPPCRAWMADAAWQVIC
jgi:hypothetical protein